MSRKINFFEGCSWFKFNNLVLALKFYSSVAKWLKLKVRKIWGLIFTLVEVKEKLVRRVFPPSSWIILKRVNIEHFSFNRSYKFHQCITKNIIIIRASNVWIKFIPFINGMRKKEFLKYSVLQGNIWKLLGCLWEFLICGSKL